MTDGGNGLLGTSTGEQATVCAPDCPDVDAPVSGQRCVRAAEARSVAETRCDQPVQKGRHP
jgi:hypothetical protein